MSSGPQGGGSGSGTNGVQSITAGNNVTLAGTAANPIINASGVSASSLIPTMTGYTTPSGIASASSEDSSVAAFAWKAFDGNDATGWEPTVAASTNAWVQYEFASPVIATEVVILSSLSNTFNLSASNDGTNFVLLSSKFVGGVTKTTNNFINSSSYIYYRITLPLYSGLLYTFQLYGYSSSVPTAGYGTTVSGTSVSVDTNVIPSLTNTQTFSGANSFTNQANSFTGSYSGNGGSLTNITASFFDSIAQALIGGIVQTTISTSSISMTFSNNQFYVNTPTNINFNSATILTNVSSVFLLHHATNTIQFSSPQSACAAAVSGDAIEMLPGVYWLTNQLVLTDGIKWHSDVGSMFYSSNGAAVFSNVVADVKVGNNDWLDGFYLTVSNITLQSIPLGCGQSDTSCTNIELDNIFIVGDSEGVVFASNSNPPTTGHGYNWNITSAEEAYKQLSTNAIFSLDKFYFNVTNDLKSPIVTSVRYGIRDVNGSLTALNGYIKCTESTASETNQVRNVGSEGINLSQAISTNYFILSNVAFDDSLWSGTNTASCDEYILRSGVTSAVNTNSYAFNCQRLDGNPSIMIFATAGQKEKLNGGSYMAGWGSDTSPSIFANPPGGNGSPTTAQTNNTGFSFPGGTNVDVSYKGVGYNLPVIQAGTTNVTAATTVVITFPRAMPSTNYTAFVAGNGLAIAGQITSAKTTTNFTSAMTAFTGNIDWSIILQTQ